MKTEYKQVWITTFPGFYGTWFEANPDYMELENYYDLEHLPEGKEIWDYFESDEYERDVCESCSLWINGELRDVFGTNIHVEYDTMVSPREYNFYNDQLYVKIEVEDDEKFRADFYAWAESHKDYIAKCLKRDFEPRSGFIPFYDDDYNEFMSKMEFGDTAWGFILSYMIEYPYHENLEYTADLMMYEHCEVYPVSYFNVPEELKIG